MGLWGPDSANVQLSSMMRAQHEHFGLQLDIPRPLSML